MCNYIFLRSKERKYLPRLQRLQKVLLCERRLRNTATTIGEIYSIPNLLNSIFCLVEVFDFAYYQIESEFSLKVFITVLFCVAYFVFKLILILESSVFATIKV